MILVIAETLHINQMQYVKATHKVSLYLKMHKYLFVVKCSNQCCSSTLIVVRVKIESQIELISLGKMFADLMQ